MRLSQRFNLVIENLIFSSPGSFRYRQSRSKFQSRNRESYLFKYVRFDEAVDIGMVSIS